MRIYKYKCRKCHLTFSPSQGHIAVRDRICPHCGSILPGTGLGFVEGFVL